MIIREEGSKEDRKGVVKKKKKKKVSKSNSTLPKEKENGQFRTKEW